ncbi:MAG: cbb3-type cytochrome c oxidase subunit I [Deltaproteobacteria bacterium]|nr:cbb3-type cytochrome c oxidase subunit I [Deltaproteobacteria bacterium]
MGTYSGSIPAPGQAHDKTRPAGVIVYGWLLLSVLSLVFAGVFALLLALARTPVIEAFLPLGRDYIFVALVGHVVLAVVIWFLAFEGFLWIYSASVHIGQCVWSGILGWASLAFSGAGVALVVISALFGLGQAELANYVPVLLTPVFYVGLGCFALGVLLNLINGMAGVLRARVNGIRLPNLTIGMAVAAFAIFTAFVCFALSAWFQISTGKLFLDFERLFWGGGHILQFANTISLVTVLMFLAYLICGKEALSSGASKVLYGIYLLFIIPAPFIFFIYDTSSQAYKDSFTALMRWGLGPSTAVFMLAAAILVFSKKGMSFKRPGFSSLVLAVVIFAAGGTLALMIRGVNTIIPAHYHSVIGAVTIAFMGLFYELLPAFKRTIYSKKMAAVQPYLYFAGILMFALGLYIAGTHGVARKTYGSAQNLNSAARIIGMSVMGLGGLISIAGGITFVWNALLTLMRKEDAAAPAFEFDAR